MRNNTFNMVSVFLMSIFAGYLFPVILNSKMHIPLLHGKTGAFLKSENLSYATPDANFYGSFSSLPEPVQAFLKTAAQISQYEYVLSKLDEYQLPHELALIPIIESQYNPTAISPKGAAGLWQLMPNTAKDYGLLENERFELEASTNAALHHLRQLYHQFGSWDLAIAAYNAGSKKVQDALIKNPSAKSIQELSLPTETKKYINTYYLIQTYFTQEA